LEAKGKTNKGEVVFAKLPRNSRRGGILGHARMLTLTSNGVEKAPVEPASTLGNDEASSHSRTVKIHAKF